MFRTLLEMKRRAERLAAAQGHASGPDGKRDALRHLIGSALFTRRFGRPLAWIVGETMEFGSWIARHNSREQRDMDRHNNAIGREIAMSARSENEVVALALEAIEHGRARWIVDDEREPAGSE